MPNEPAITKRQDMDTVQQSPVKQQRCYRGAVIGEEDFGRHMKSKICFVLEAVKRNP